MKKGIFFEVEETESWGRLRLFFIMIVGVFEFRELIVFWWLEWVEKIVENGEFFEGIWFDEVRKLESVFLVRGIE